MPRVLRWVVAASVLLLAQPGMAQQTGAPAGESADEAPPQSRADQRIEGSLDAQTSLADQVKAALETDAALDEGEEGEEAAELAEAEPKIRLAVLPFQINSARPLGYLTESMADFLATRMEATGRVEVVPSQEVSDALAGTSGIELSDAELKQLGQRLEVRSVISGSITELAGRFSLDVQITPSGPGRSETIVIIGESEEDLLGRLGELVDRSVAAAVGRSTGKILAIEVLGAHDLEPAVRALLLSQQGADYDPTLAHRDRSRVEGHPGIASVNLEVKREPSGVVLEFQVVRSEMILVDAPRRETGQVISEVRVRGNKRIDSDAILTRIGSQVGAPLLSQQVALDVREIYGLGFFNDVRAYSEKTEAGRILIFEVEENPVVRQITISGNEHIDSEKIQDILTLTSGSTLDRSLLKANTARIEALYRAEGYYLAETGYVVETIVEGSVAIHFEVDEKEKLKLKKVYFEGNEAFTDKELRKGFATKLWRPWSIATSWFDKSGTYSEPVFMRDLRSVEKLYSDAGYLQAEIRPPRVEPTEKGLFVYVEIKEGDQFSVGTITMAGDDSVDFEILRQKLQLDDGMIFNRSFLTQDVEILERHYTDRGFYFASVQPSTRLVEGEQLINVEFQVQKGPLYFIRHIDIAGNTRTIDEVVRREMELVEGQLYSARDLQISNVRVNGLGFFEDVGFNPKPTDDPSQLDLEVDVVERPTGSFSFGAGFSSQDGLVFQASLSQSNLFGHGYGVNVQIDVGGSTSRYFVSVSDPYFLDTNFSASATFFLTDVNFDDFKQLQRGFDMSFGHSLREDNTARIFARYSYSQRRIEQDTRANAAATIFREILQGNEVTSLIGVSFRSDTRNDRLSPSAGSVYGGSFDIAGLGGFSKFVRVEGRYTKFLGAPRWMFDRSSFVVSGRFGYAYSFNTMADYTFPGIDVPTSCDDGACINGAPLREVNADLTLPLAERYFLGGIGGFQLRGFKARTVGPRRTKLRRTSDDENNSGTGPIFTPVGRREDPNVEGLYICQDPGVGLNTQGNGNGRCNNLEDRDSFDDIFETDVVGGNKFVLANLEYRFPISEQIGLQGILFVDGGNSFAEGDSLFDVTKWRYGYGAGLLWFSPFGPLQVVLGFPINPTAVEKSPVFEFSVGGFVQ